MTDNEIISRLQLSYCFDDMATRFLAMWREMKAIESEQNEEDRVQAALRRLWSRFSDSDLLKGGALWT